MFLQALCLQRILMCAVNGDDQLSSLPKPSSRALPAHTWASRPGGTAARDARRSRVVAVRVGVFKTRRELMYFQWFYRYSPLAQSFGSFCHFFLLTECNEQALHINQKQPQRLFIKFTGTTLLCLQAIVFIGRVFTECSVTSVSFCRPS